VDKELLDNPADDEPAADYGGRGKDGKADSRLVGIENADEYRADMAGGDD
jgi:hypothetical protein